jgi:hypothetical protein
VTGKREYMMPRVFTGDGVTISDAPTAVYRVYELATGELISVGMSVTPENRVRMTNHPVRDRWRIEDTRWKVTWYPDRVSARAAEIYACRSEHPVIDSDDAYGQYGPACGGTGHRDSRVLDMGKTDAQRARRYRDRKRGGPPRELKPHGTLAAYRRHQRAGEPPCAACKRAEKARQHDLYLARQERAS